MSSAKYHFGKRVLCRSLDPCPLGNGTLAGPASCSGCNRAPCLTCKLQQVLSNQLYAAGRAVETTSWLLVLVTVLFSSSAHGQPFSTRELPPCWSGWIWRRLQPGPHAVLEPAHLQSCGKPGSPFLTPSFFKVFYFGDIFTFINHRDYLDSWGAGVEFLYFQNAPVLVS